MQFLAFLNGFSPYIALIFSYMQVLEINSITREESSLYYINRYKGNAVLDVMAQKVTLPLTFSIEISPLGQRTINMEFSQESLNYPVMPIKKSLKEYINQLSLEGNLP